MNVSKRTKIGAVRRFGLLASYLLFSQIVALPSFTIAEEVNASEVVAMIHRQVDAWQSHLLGKTAEFKAHYYSMDSVYPDFDQRFFESTKRTNPNAKVEVSSIIKICEQNDWNWVETITNDGSEHRTAFFKNNKLVVSRNSPTQPTDYTIRVMRDFTDKRESIWGSNAAPFYAAFGIHGHVYPHQLWKDMTFKITSHNSTLLTLDTETINYRIKITCRKLGDQWALARHEMEGYIFDPVNFPSQTPGAKPTEKRVVLFNYDESSTNNAITIPTEVAVQFVMSNTGSNLAWFFSAKLVGMSESPKLIKSFKDIFPFVENGNYVNVDGYKGIAFEWQDGEIVRRIDGKKLAVLEGHERERSPLRSILYVICLVMATVVVIRFVMLRNGRAS